MTRQEFKKQFLTNVKIKIRNAVDCYEFQRIAFEFGIKVHTGDSDPIAYNIADIFPEYRGKPFATNMDNLTINDERGMQKSAFYHLEHELKEITFPGMMTAYYSITNKN